MIAADNVTVAELNDRIGNVDMAPTLCALAGVNPDSNVVIDGRSFAPFLTGGSVDPWRKYFLLTRDSFPQVKFTFGEYSAEQDHNQGEYYNLLTDAPQTDSKYGDLEDDLLDLQDKLDVLRHCSGSGCRTAEETEIGT